MADSKYVPGRDLLLGSRTIPMLNGNTRFRDLATGLLIVLLLYGTILMVYRLYLSPLASFPGPRLAAATEWYEFYYQLVRDGQWGDQVRRLHERYGETRCPSTRELIVI